MNDPLDNFSIDYFEAEENASATQPKKNRGGRPKQIDTEQLFNRRDQLIYILSFAWGDIGWELLTARTCEQVRAAFACLKGRVHSNEYLLRPFWRVPTAAASATEIRKTKSQRARLTSSAYTLVEIREPLAEKLRRSSSTLKQKTDNENLETLLEEHFQRMVLFRTNAHQLNSAENELKKLEIKLEEQEAAYSQTELLDFIRNEKYAHNPRNLAQAMAGLPDVGCSYSLQECQKKPSPLWPIRPDEIPTLSYRTFQLIEKCWNKSKETDRPIAEILRERIRAIPPFNDLGTNLIPDVRYLRQAVEQTDLKELPSLAVPYRIFAAFLRNRGKLRSYEEYTLAEIEAGQI